MIDTEAMATPRRRLALSVPLTLGAAALVLSTAGCGGGEAASERLAEEILERSAEQASGNDGEDIDIDLDIDGDGSGSVSVDMGNGQMAMGEDLPRPDWLPSGFPIPDGAKITYSVNDVAAGQAGLGGDAPGTLDQVRSGYVSAMESFGARLITPEGYDDRSLVWQIPDGRVAEIALLSIQGGGVQFTLALNVEEDIERLEDAVAGPSEFLGRAVAVVDAETFIGEGTCQLAVDYANFASTGDPTEPQISVSVQGSSVNGTVTVVDESGDVRIWILSESGDTTGSFDRSSISVAGPVMNVMTGDVDIPASIDVTCD